MKHWRVNIVAHEYGSVVIAAKSDEAAIEAAKNAEAFGDVSFHTREIEIGEVEYEDDDEYEEEN